MADRPMDLVDRILLTGRAGSRFLGDGAVLRPVWRTYIYGRRGKHVDLILTPLDSTPAARLARLLADAVRDRAAPGVSGILPLEGAVVTRVDLKAFIGLVLPATGLDLVSELEGVRQLIASRPEPPARLNLEDLWFDYWPTLVVTGPGDGAQRWQEDRTVTLRHVIDLAASPDSRLNPGQRQAALAVLAFVLARAEPGRAPAVLNSEEADVPLEAAMFGSQLASMERMIWRVGLNRRVERMMMSVETIKADAARRVFELDCRDVTWAVIDSGIDGSHPAFRDHDVGEFATRIDHAYDFTRLRRYASYDVLDAGMGGIAGEVAGILHLDQQEAQALLSRLREDAAHGRPLDWDALSRLIEIPPDTLPPVVEGKVDPHGTHVAGVLAGDWRENDSSVFRGVCPNLRLYDLRILGPEEETTEVAMIAALEFVRWLNGRNRFMTIHGVNLSVGLEHDVENFACGQTPVCLACNATVSAGVVVVAAAGNWGSRRYASIDGDFRGFAPISIADPGNAEKVITVGATHRERPHEYGISFFSSRGPTGDGRAKPDLVAPGERIDGPLPELGFGQLDGTSMAAPHVSGVAAMLLARFPEMIGRPERIKATLVASATDLGRERSFQGAGLVDALRALQSL